MKGNEKMKKVLSALLCLWMLGLIAPVVTFSAAAAGDAAEYSVEYNVTGGGSVAITDGDGNTFDKGDNFNIFIVRANTDVIVKVKAGTGYLLDSITVQTAGGDPIEPSSSKPFGFLMPSEDVIVNVVFKACEHPTIENDICGACDAQVYPLWYGSTQFAGAQGTDIAGIGGALYNHSTGTLSLEPDIYSGTFRYAGSGKLTVKVTGDTTLESGINVPGGELAITGSGKLVIQWMAKAAHGISLDSGTHVRIMNAGTFGNVTLSEGIYGVIQYGGFAVTPGRTVNDCSYLEFVGKDHYTVACTADGSQHAFTCGCNGTSVIFEDPHSVEDNACTVCGVIPYHLEIGGKQVVKLPGDGPVVTGNENVTYDPVENVLTLDNATISGGVGGVGIDYYGTKLLKLELKGKNTVSGQLFGIRTNDHMTVTGDGGLEVSGETSGIHAVGAGLSLTGNAHVKASRIVSDPDSTMDAGLYRTDSSSEFIACEAGTPIPGDTYLEFLGQGHSKEFRNAEKHGIGCGCSEDPVWEESHDFSNGGICSCGQGRYPLWVAGDQVMSMGDAESIEVMTGVTYKPETDTTPATLILNDANIDVLGKVGIKYSGDRPLNLVLTGKNIVNGGMQARNGIAISGSGSLQADTIKDGTPLSVTGSVHVITNFGSNYTPGHTLGAGLYRRSDSADFIRITEEAVIQEAGYLEFIGDGHTVTCQLNTADPVWHTLSCTCELLKQDMLHKWDETAYCPDCRTKAVASVGDGTNTGYFATLEAAVAAWNRNTSLTLTLLDDVTAATPSQISVGKFGCTLELNGHSLTGYSLFVQTYAGLIVQDNGTGGRIYNSDRPSIEVDGDLFIMSGTIASGSMAAVYAPGNGRVIMNNGLLEGVYGFQGRNFAANGGTIKGTENNAAIYLMSGDNNSLSGLVTIQGDILLENPSCAFKVTSMILDQWTVRMGQTGVFAVYDGVPLDPAAFVSGSKGYVVAGNDMELKLVPSITEDMVTIPHGTYNGSEQSPSVSVMWTNGFGRNDLLDPDTDYTVDCPEGMKNAGTYTVTVTGKGEYTGTVKVPFIIDPMEVTDASVTVADATYDGTRQKPAVTVEGYDKKDYTVTYTNNVNAGTGTAAVTFRGNYSGTIEKAFTIHPRLLTDPTVTGLEESYPYTGEAIRPELTVKDGDTTLVKDRDYTLTYGSNTTVAEGGTVKLQFTGNYSGSKDLSFVITRADPAVTVPTGLTAAYGDALSSVQLPQTGNGTWRWEKADDKVGDAGERTHKAVFAPVDTANYNTLKRDVTVKVSPRALTQGSVTVTVEEEDLTYDGNPKTPGVTVSGVPEDAEFDVTYSNNTNAGTAAAAVTFRGNYSGTIEKAFTIHPRLLTDPTVTGLEESYPYTGKAIRPEISVKDGDTTLVKDRDYTLTYGSNTTVAEGGTVKLQFTGNYSGSKDLSFAITRADPAVTVPTGLTAAYGDALSSVQLPQAANGTWRWEKADDKVGDAGERTHKAVFAPVDTANYNTLKADVTVKVSPRALTQGSVTVTVEAEDLVYDGNPKTPGVTVSGAPEDAEFDVTYSNNTNAGTAAAAVTFRGNYSGTFTVSFTIAKAPAKFITAPAAVKDLVYNGKAQTLVKAGRANQQTTARAASDNVEYSLNGTAWSETLPTGTNAGSYTVYYRARETANYKASDSKTLTAVIERAQITVDAGDVTVKAGTAADQVPYSYTVTGLLGSDKLKTEPSFSVAGLDLSKTGDYIITPGGADAGGNYAIAYRTGTLKVRAERTVTNDHTDNGTVTISPEKAVEGTQVTVTVKPEDGYRLSTLAVTDANGKTVHVRTDNAGRYYFTMPDADVTVKTAFTKISVYTPDSTNPKTGDDFRILLWTGMMLTSLFGMAVLAPGKKKSDQR